jgi:predicted outer membrane protein
MLNNNKAHVELCQFAAQQAQSPKVKQFAQQLAKDHQQCVEKLQQIAGTTANGRPAGSTSLGASPVPGTAAAPATELNRDANATATTGRPSMTRGNAALQQLAGIEQKINEQCQQALREELQQKSGAEFDACFLGAQVAGHMHVLAALEVIPQEVKGPLKQVAEDARPTIRKHLDEAKQLMKQASAAHGSAQAQRTSTVTETQR